MKSLKTLPQEKPTQLIDTMQPLNLLDVSERQDPVVDRLANLLDEAKATAAAISDNAIEEQRSIPSDLLRSFNNDLERIKAHLLTAADVP